MAIQVLHTTSAHAEGGRNGHTRSQDGIVDVDLSVPKGMGGPGKPNTTTPEDLFAAGYAACFCGAADFVAKNQLKLSPSSLAVDCSVAIGKSDDGGFGLQAEIKLTASGLSQADAQKLVEAAHAFCPYSKATRNNIEVKLTAVAA